MMKGTTEPQKKKGRKNMNELIILGIMLAVFEIPLILYGVAGIVYHKLIRKSKKSIWKIMGEL